MIMNHVLVPYPPDGLQFLATLQNYWTLPNLRCLLSDSALISLRSAKTAASLGFTIDASNPGA